MSIRVIGDTIAAPSMTNENKTTRVQAYLDDAEMAEFEALMKAIGLGKSATIKTALRQLALKHADQITREK